MEAPISEHTGSGNSSSPSDVATSDSNTVPSIITDEVAAQMEKKFRDVTGAMEDLVKK